MLIEIKNRFNGKVILSGEYESLKDCLVKNSGADLSGADLSGADLSGANEIILPIISISGTKDNFYYLDGVIRIGCEGHTVEKWMTDYAEIGRQAGYTESEIEEYYRYIKFCADLKPEAK